MIPIYKPFLNGNEKKYVNECLDSTWISSKGGFIPKFEDGIKNYNDVFGVIGWKQFDTNVSLVYKDQFMIDKIVNQMELYKDGKFDNVKPPVVRKKRARSEAVSPPESPVD